MRLENEKANELFDDLYRRHGEAIYGFLRWKNRGGDSTKDLLQQTFLQVFEALRLGQGPERGHEAAWLRTIAQNVFNNVVRFETASKRRPIGRLESLEESEDIPQYRAVGVLDDPERRAISNEDRVRMDRAFGELPPRCQETARLFFLDGLTSRQISMRLSIAEGTVKAHIHRARKLLQHLLGPRPLY